jgi:hypothetical protein
MTEAKLIRGVAGTLLSYPRVERDGSFLRKQPVSCVVRFSTPASAMPAEGAEVTADVDGVNAVTTADAAEGADELTLGAASSTPVTDTDTVPTPGLASGGSSSGSLLNGGIQINGDTNVGFPADLGTYNVTYLFTLSSLTGSLIVQIDAVVDVIDNVTENLPVIVSQSATILQQLGDGLDWSVALAVILDGGQHFLVSQLVLDGDTLASGWFTWDAVADGEIDPVVAAGVTLADNTTYDVTADIDAVNVVAQAHLAATLTAVVSVANGVATIVSQSLERTVETGAGRNWDAEVAVVGLVLNLMAQGDATSGTWTSTLTATPRVVTTATAGRHYLLVGDTIDDEVVADFASSSSLSLAEPLVEDVPLGTRVLGWGCSVDLDADDTDLVGDGIALWTATFDDGSEASWAQAFRVVRRLPGVTLTPTELTTSWPAIVNMRPPADKNFEETIAAAWRDDIEDLLLKKQVDPEDVIADGGLKALWALACVRKLAMLRDDVSDKVKDDLEKRWNLKSTDLLARNDWYDAPQDETPAPRPPEPPAIRTGIRLSR